VSKACVPVMHWGLDGIRELGSGTGWIQRLARPELMLECLPDDALISGSLAADTLFDLELDTFVIPTILVLGHSVIR